MSIFRSEEMKHMSIRIPKDSANEIMRALGNLDYSIEFVDLTKDDLEAKKNYGQLIHRCDEILKKIQDFNDICSDFAVIQNKYDKYIDFKKDIEKDIKNRDKKFGSYYFDLLENEILENDKRIKELVESHSNIREDLLNLIEKKYVFAKTRDLINNREMAQNYNNNIDNSLDNNLISINNLNFMAGTINIGDELKMKRMIFRVSRGRALTTFYDLYMNQNEYNYSLPLRKRGFKLSENENNNNNNNLFLNNIFNYGTVVKKKIFNIMFPGGDENILLNKILKVCEIFQASRFNVPRNNEINNELNKLENDISDKKTLLLNIEKNINDIIVGNSYFENKPNIRYNMYKLYYLQEKLIYSTLNKCKLLGNFLDGEVWIPTKKLPEVHNILNNIGKKSENFAPATLIELPFDDTVVPPTFIPTNEFFASFQEVVDTFGIPHYREINPGIFTVITFPFLFGIMFGDIAHGSLLLITAIYLCINKNSIEKSNNMFKTALPYRYFLLFMGISATYCGWCYNDFLSFPINFGTCYEHFYPPDDKPEVYDYTIDNIYDKMEKKYHEFDVYKKDDCVYKFGVDPIWMSASNELTFINSLKMKISVIFGVLQMLLGIFLKGLNALFSRDFTEFIFVFIPQFILMTILFGYMDLLIFIKWSTNYDKYNNVTKRLSSLDFDSPLNLISTRNASDIKTVLMNIFLKFGKVPDDDWALWGTKGKMKNTHMIILITSLLCMICMIFPKVFIKYSQLNSKYKSKNQIIDNNNNNLIDEQQHMLIPKNEMNKPSFSDIFVNQVIESIEFILGTVSNTASYLRLWALSLAHSQLSKVFFERSLGYGLRMSGNFFVNGIFAALFFVIFAVITLGILMFMDCLECFLHTLRLHWVEFQNKFYKADGYSFNPYSFSQIMKENEINE